jgi:hypothetical protein
MGARINQRLTYVARSPLLACRQLETRSFDVKLQDVSCHNFSSKGWRIRPNATHPLQLQLRVLAVFALPTRPLPRPLSWSGLTAGGRNGAYNRSTSPVVAAARSRVPPISSQGQRREHWRRDNEGNIPRLSLRLPTSNEFRQEYTILPHPAGQDLLEGQTWATAIQSRYCFR